MAIRVANMMPKTPVGPLPTPGGGQHAGQRREDGLSDGVAAVGQAQHPAPGLGKPGRQRGGHGKGRYGGVADAGEYAVENEHLPQVSGETGGPPAEQDAQPGQGKEDPSAPAVQQDAQQGRGNGSDEAGQGKDRRGVGGAAAKGIPQGVEIDGLAVLGAALDGEVAQGQDEDDPPVVEPGAGGLQHGRTAGRPIVGGRIGKIPQNIRRLYTPEAIDKGRERG